MDKLAMKSNIAILTTVLNIFELRKNLRKHYGLTLDDYLVLIYLNEFKNRQGKYFMRDVITYIGLDQSRIVKSVKELVKKGYLSKSRDLKDSRNVILTLTELQQKTIENILNEIIYR
ncbi:TPA: winged helix DNA-binding protein [Staphylococcus aureus]|nr:winged helix DNA-binding protein [Staphylococcus aureus]